MLCLANPPVNGLALALRRSFMQAMQRAADDAAVRAIVLCGAGRGFCAGGDIREFGTPDATALPGVSSHMHVAIEASRKPVVAAIHGFAIGGVSRPRWPVTTGSCWRTRRSPCPRSGSARSALGHAAPAAADRVGPALDAIAGARRFSAATSPAHRCSTGFSSPPRTRPRRSSKRRSPSRTRCRAIRCRWYAICRCTPGCGRAACTGTSRLPGMTNPAPAWAIDAIEAAVNAPDFETGLATARRLWQDSMASEQLRERRDRFLS